MDKDLRLFAASIVVELELSKSAKQHLLNFVKEEATDAQVKALLMDGKIVQLDKQAEEVINDRFIISEAGGRVAKLRKSYMGMAGAGGGLSPLWLAYRTIRGQFDKCTKKCGSYEINTSRRQHCMTKCKVGKMQAQLVAAQKTKDAKQIAKAKAGLLKAQVALKKSVASFKKRGADV